MVDKPCTSTEADQHSSLPNNEREKRSGGNYCCVPFCDSNTKRNPELSFHKFPTERMVSLDCPS